MQTFLPYYNFYNALNCLDYKRLGKQRVEAKQILDILLNRTPESHWRNHPAVKMWRRYEEVLKLYYNKSIILWKDRGYKNNMELEDFEINKFIVPPWLGDKQFHDSHKSNLLRKDPEFYGKYGWNVPNDLPYVWPEGKY